MALSRFPLSQTQAGTIGGGHKDTVRKNAMNEARLLDPFRDALSRSRGIFGGAIEGIGGIADQFGEFAQGFDPVLDAQREQALNASRQGLERRGLGGSSVLANEQARINQGFVTQGLARRDQQLGAQAGLLGQQAGLSEDAANLELAIPQIEIARTAAENAGRGGGGTVICTLLRDRGHMADEVYEADCEYGEKHISPYTLLGYQTWAFPLVKQMAKRAWLYNIWRPIGHEWALHMAFKLGRPCGKRSYIIPVLGIIGVPACYVLGRALALRQAWKTWRTYNPRWEQ